MSSRDAAPHVKQFDHWVRTCYVRVEMLNAADVRRMGAAAGFTIGDDDLSEITHRLNAFLDALAPLASLPLERVEPWPTLPDSS